MNGRIVFLDAETTGLDHRVHEGWEWGLIVRDEAPLAGEYGTRTEVEYLWRVKPDLTKADPEALRVSNYYERTAGLKHHMDDAWNVAPGVWSKTGEVGDRWSVPSAVAAKLARLIDGAVVVGANPGFDKDMLRPFLHKHGQAYTAHYRPMCVTGMGYGYLCGVGKAEGLRWPLSSAEVSARLGVDPAAFDRHTALGDAHWCLKQYEVITGNQR